MREGIYIASKSKHGHRWQTLRAAGYPVVSTWIDESGEGATSDWADLWDRCIGEASGAAALVMYVEPGEIHKGSLVELGAALHADVPVFWVGPEYSTAPRHRLVRRVETLEEGLRLALGCCLLTKAQWALASEKRHILEAVARGECFVAMSHSLVDLGEAGLLVLDHQGPSMPACPWSLTWAGRVALSTSESVLPAVATTG